VTRVLAWLGRVLAGGLLLGLQAGGPAHAQLPIQHWQTSTGARVYFVESRVLPMLDVAVEVPAGSGRDAREQSGLASLVLRMLRMGAQGLNEEQISQQLADVGANLGQTFDFDRAGYALRTLSAPGQRVPALEVLARVLAHPTFPQDAFERERARVLAGLKEADAKPDSIGVREFARLVYRDHPYAHRASGTASSLSLLTSQDLRDFHAAHYQAANAVVSIIGDVSRQEAEAIAEQLTAELPRGVRPIDPLPAVAPLTQPGSSQIAHPAVQAHILIGAPGVSRGDPDLFPLVVGNYVLGGGGFTSRLYQEVRDQRGLSYSVYSAFAPYEQAGAFQIGLQTRKDQAAQALQIVRSTLKTFIEQGPTEAELEGAKQNLVGGFPLRLDSNKKILDYLMLIGFYRLPLDYLDTYPRRVEAVTADQIREAFQRHIDPERLITVVVGASDAPASK
jgi:zinc protease